MPKNSVEPLTTFDAGTCNTIDDETGLKVKLSEVRKRWNGMFVTEENWEPRQPQDFPRVPRTSKVFKNVRGEPDIISYTPPDKSTLGSE